MAQQTEVTMSKVNVGDTLYHVDTTWKNGKRVHELTPRVVASVGRKWIKFQETWIGRIEVTSLCGEAYGNRFYRSVEEYQEHERKKNLVLDVARNCSHYLLGKLSADQLQAILDIIQGAS
jgi:hypothetical protein